MDNFRPHAHVFGAGPGVAHAGPGAGSPRFWYLHLTYCVLLGLVYVACMVGAVFYLLYRDTIAASDIPTADLAQLDVTVILCGIVSLPLAIAFLAAPFLPRKPWAWTAHLILCCIGLTSACCLPMCIPVLITWLKPETKAWFGKR